MNKIIFISGTPAAGKSTIGRRLAEHFPKSLHIRVDELRSHIVNGAAMPSLEWSYEAVNQFRLVRTTATQMAKLYADNGFDVVIDDVCVPESFVDQYAELFQTPGVSRVLLTPSVAAITERLHKRQDPFDHFFLENNTAEWIYSYLQPMNKAGWIVIDSSNLTIEETTAEVLKRIDAQQK